MEILPIPVAAIDVTPNQVDILNPLVWVEYLGDQNVDCYYSFGDGGGLEGCQGQYIYSDGGTFTITQTVVNEFGCANTAEGQVSVSGSVFYAHGFHPGRRWPERRLAPRGARVSEYALRITNRWGNWCLKRPIPTSLGSVKWARRPALRAQRHVFVPGHLHRPDRLPADGGRTSPRGTLTQIGLFLHTLTSTKPYIMSSYENQDECTAAPFGQASARISLT